MQINIETLTGFYWYAAIIGTVVFILKTSLPLDMGGEVQGDFNTMTDTDTSFNFLTVEGIAAFFMSGGWMGWAAISHLGYGIKISSIAAIISGILGMLFFAWLITKFKKLEHTPVPDLKELNGKTGKAYMAFSPKGTGKIQIEYNSKLETLDAVNDTEEEIKAFDPVEVVKIENDNIYIKKK